MPNGKIMAKALTPAIGKTTFQVYCLNARPSCFLQNISLTIFPIIMNMTETINGVSME